MNVLNLFQTDMKVERSMCISLIWSPSFNKSAETPDSTVEPGAAVCVLPPLGAGDTAERVRLSAAAEQDTGASS